MISDQIALHSVQLPLYIVRLFGTAAVKKQSNANIMQDLSHTASLFPSRFSYSTVQKECKRISLLFGEIYLHSTVPTLVSFAKIDRSLCACVVDFKLSV